MAEREFFNTNEHISYPLEARAHPRLATPDIMKGLVDAGFMLGPLAEFVTGTHNVYLYAIEVQPTYLRYDFRSDAPGLTGAYQWLFELPWDAEYGCTVALGATPIGGGSQDELYGYGFINVGAITQLQALGDGTHVLSPVWNVEPACLQNLTGSRVERVVIANDARRYPGLCSSSSSAGPNEAFVAPDGDNLQGTIQFREGYNARVMLLNSDNAVFLTAAVGAGSGNTCYDYIIDENGTRKDPDELGMPLFEACNQFILSLNGRSFKDSNGRIRLLGPAGATVEPDPENHRVTVRLKPYG